MPIPVTLPNASPVTQWMNQPLVRIDASIKGADGTSVPLPPWKALQGGVMVNGRTISDESAYFSLPVQSLEDAVTAASALSQANGRTIVDNIANSDEKYSPALAVLQARTGAWYYATKLGSVPNTFGDAGWASIDIGGRGLSIKDVKQLNPDVAAVVGMNSWVNFTTTAANPKLADPRPAAEVAATK